MAKFMLLYKGPATPMEEMSAEERGKIGQNWANWMKKVGSAMVDMGQPMVGGTVVVDDGSSAEASDFTGFSIIEADGLDKAKELVDGHPFLSDKSGKFSIEVHELAPAPDFS